MTVREPDRPERDSTGGLAESTRRAERSDHSPWNWVLVLPLLATLIPPLYNQIDPTLADIPFFYWYQLAAIAIGVSTTLLVFMKTRG